jgi:hypothetical protein
MIIVAMLLLSSCSATYKVGDSEWTLYLNSYNPIYFYVIWILCSIFTTIKALQSQDWSFKELFGCDSKLENLFTVFFLTIGSPFTVFVMFIKWIKIDWDKLE